MHIIPDTKFDKNEDKKYLGTNWFLKTFLKVNWGSIKNPSNGCQTIWSGLAPKLPLLPFFLCLLGVRCLGQSS